PTPAVALAERILTVAGALRPQSYGTWHCAGAERTSWFDFATAIFAVRREITGQPRPRLTPIATADYPTAARRPADSTLDSKHFQATFATGPIDWRAGLKDVLHRLVR